MKEAKIWSKIRGESIQKQMILVINQLKTIVKQEQR